MRSSKTFASMMCVAIAVAAFAATPLLLGTSASAAESAEPSPAGSAALAQFLERAGMTTPASIADSPDIAEVDPTGISSPEPLSPSTDSFSTFGAYQDTFECVDQWEYVAARKNSYVTGNCHSGWKLARTTRDYEPNPGTGQGYWDGGYINGDYDGCGWMRQVDTTAHSSEDTTACQSPDRPNCEFMFCDASHPDGYIYGSFEDGQSMPVTLPGGCPEVANYRPWSNTPTPTTAGAADGVTLRWKPQGQTMRVRFIAKAPWMGYYFVMARDPSITTEGRGNWVFMQTVCFA